MVFVRLAFRITFAVTMGSIAFFSVALFWVAGEVVGQDGLSKPDIHPWAKLQPGSWKRVRDVCKTIGRGGAVVGTTVSETTTTLAEMDDTSYTLCTETTIEFGGKKFVGQPRNTKFGLQGEPVGRAVLVKKVGEAEIDIGGNRVPTEVRQVIVEGAEERQVSSVFYSEKIPPHILKRETVATDSLGKATRHKTRVEVVGVEIPFTVLSEVKPTTYVRTVQSQPGGAKTVHVAVHCPDVPGSVVYQTTKKLDQSGALTEQRTFELVDYETLRADAAPRTGRRRLLPRSRGQNQ